MCSKLFGFLWDVKTQHLRTIFLENNHHHVSIRPCLAKIQNIKFRILLPRINKVTFYNKNFYRLNTISQFSISHHLYVIYSLDIAQLWRLIFSPSINFFFFQSGRKSYFFTEKSCCSIRGYTCENAEVK